MPHSGCSVLHGVNANYIKRMHPCILYDDSNPNNIIFAIKGRKYHVPVVTLSSNGSQKLSNLLKKELERPVY